jgi:Domain of unknown function (DUF1996)
VFEFYDVRVLAPVVAGGVIVLLAAMLGPAALAQYRPDPVDGRKAATRAELAGVNFIEVCRFSHTAPDDPIVFFGKPGASHDHSFVGSRGTNASSSFPTLRAAGTTCERKSDTAAYWVPTLFKGTAAILPTAATIYYRRSTLARVRSFPPNLRMIAGSATATAPQGMRITWWSCGAASGVKPSAAIPSCPNVRGSGLRLHIRFPSCWNGSQLDSADHKSHLAYPVNATCSSTHPVSVPELTQIYRYPSRGGAELYLASGGQFSAHADFVNSWRQPTLRWLVENCLDALVQCGRG